MVITKMGFAKFPFLSSPATSMFSLVLVMVWKSVGYYVLLIMAALQTVPSNIYEAAELDSTPKWRVFFKITLPMISPTILFTSVVASIASFKIFDSVNVMTQGGPVDSTNTLVYYIYSFAFRYGKPGMACAGRCDLTDPGMHYDLCSVWCRKETGSLPVMFSQKISRKGRCIKTPREHSRQRRKKTWKKAGAHFCFRRYAIS